MKKPKNRRLATVNPKRYSRTVRWKIDYDYLDKLSPEEKKWLAEFTREWLDNPKSHTPKFFKSKKDLKETRSNRNAARRDIASRDTGYSLDQPTYLNAVQSEKPLYARAELAKMKWEDLPLKVRREINEAKRRKPRKKRRGKKHNGR